MRIAIVTWCDRIVGGAESYLATVIPALERAGHEVRVWTERSAEPTRERIADPDHVTRVVETGADAWLASLAAWKPAIIYTHGLTDPALEAQTLPIAPRVFFGHNYYGTCVSGEKTWKRPSVRTCTRSLGPGCLAHYYPHRCGGLDPRTMARDYRVQRRRLRNVRAATTVLTASEHMRSEFLRNGCRDDQVHAVPLPVVTDAPVSSADRSTDTIRLAFAGRMDHLKGGQVLIEALPHVVRGSKPLHLTFLGDGPERRRWETLAAQTTARIDGVSIEFRGWVARDTRNQTLAAADLFVMPSLWPEPFGLAGLEAGRLGIPAVAFRVGGIPEWLEDGVNGALAELEGGAPALAAAITRCLDDDVRPRLSRGARTLAERYTLDRHLAALLPLLDQAAR